MQFFILMIDYGKGPARPMGLEAVCNPELTRREIVSQVADIMAGDRNAVAFVKFVDGNYIEDVTAEIVADAEVLMMEAA